MFNTVISNKGYWTYYDLVNTSASYSNATVHYCLNQRCAGGNRCENDRDPNAPLCAACKPGMLLNCLLIICRIFRMEWYIIHYLFLFF